MKALVGYSLYMVMYLLASLVIFSLLVACAGERGPQGPRGEAGPIGQPGQDGADMVVQVIDPCGQETEFDEVILRLADGRLYAFFVENRQGRMVLLDKGDFVTTDGTNCHFTVTDEGDVAWD